MPSIASSASQAAAGLVGIQAQVSAFIDQAILRSAGGLTWSEFGELLIALLRLTVSTLDHIGGLTGPQKKELALEAVAALFDQLAGRAVPAAAYPLFLLVRPAARSLILALAGGAIEVILPMTRAE